jgi:protein-tyrosine sulfotransferase
MAARNRLTAMMSQTSASIAPDLMESKLRNPFFFIGCGRSGTTLFASLLASHHDIAVYPYEANEMWHPSSYPWYRSSRSTLPIWIDPYTFTQASLNSRTERDDKRIKAVFGACQFVLRGKCFVNKSVMVTFMMPYILKLFPDARFIHIVRDGRAVALSFALKEKAMIKKYPWPYKQRGIDFSVDELTGKFAEYWKQHILEIERQKECLDLENSGLIHELRYEDLCLNPHEQLALIARFMGLDADEFGLRDYSQIRDTNYKYQQRLNPDVIEKISTIMQPALSIKNYATC